MNDEGTISGREKGHQFHRHLNFNHKTSKWNQLWLGGSKTNKSINLNEIFLFFDPISGAHVGNGKCGP